MIRLDKVKILKDIWNHHTSSLNTKGQKSKNGPGDYI